MCCVCRKIFSGPGDVIIHHRNRKIPKTLRDHDGISNSVGGGSNIVVYSILTFHIDISQINVKMNFVKLLLSVHLAKWCLEV